MMNVDRGVLVCKRLKRRIVISFDAVEDDKYGWLCDCGHWSKIDVHNHYAAKNGRE